MRKICDTVETQVRSLKNLDIQSEMYRPLLIPVLLSKLSSELSLIINLKSEGTQQFKLKVSGANPTAENLDYVKVENKSFSNTASIFVKCYVKDICKPILKQYINFAKNRYPHLKHLSLAD